MWLYCVIADIIAIPVGLVMLLQRKKTVRRIVLWLGVGMPTICLLMVTMFGPDSLATLVSIVFYALQMLMGFAYMIIQFVGIFWYMARTRATEVYPGQKGVITFDDYWGQPQLKREVAQWTQLLTKRKEFERMGGVAINGILLHGPPGTGKTFLARALAGSAGVPFYGIDGSSFRAMFWGVDVLKVRGFFARLRKDAKAWGGAVGFLDEIDAIARSRTSGQGGQAAMGGGMMGMAGMGALNRLLYELDGIDEVPLMDQAKNRVRAFCDLPLIDPGRFLVMASTNVPEVLDRALLRSGRLDIKIQVGEPDHSSRKEVIEGYLATIEHDGNIDVDSLVADTNKRTPADLMVSITKLAVKRALFDGRDAVTQLDIEMALQEQAMGLENPISDLEPRQKRQIAIHEAGHAVVLHVLRPRKRIVCLTIVRRDRALGYMMPVDEVDVYAAPLREIQDDILVSLAGDVATETVLGERWTGAAGDLDSIQARLWYLHKHGWFGSYPMSNTPTPADQEMVDRVMDAYRDTTEEILTDHKDALIRLADALYERETLTYKEVMAILEGEDEDEDEEDLAVALGALDLGDASGADMAGG